MWITIVLAIALVHPSAAYGPTRTYDNQADASTTDLVVYGSLLVLFLLLFATWICWCSPTTPPRTLVRRRLHA